MCTLIILYKGLEHPEILVFMGGPVTNFPQIPREAVYMFIVKNSHNIKNLPKKNVMVMWNYTTRDNHR